MVYRTTIQVEKVVKPSDVYPATPPTNILQSLREGSYKIIAFRPVKVGEYFVANSYTATILKCTTLDHTPQNSPRFIVEIVDQLPEWE